jgi:hypothetical protein
LDRPNIRLLTFLDENAVAALVLVVDPPRWFAAGIRW